GKAAGLDALQERSHQVLIPADPLQVRTLAEISGPPERQRLGPVDEVPTAAEVQLGEPVVDGEREAEPHSADVIDHLLEPGEIQFDEMVEVQMSGVLDGLPQAAGTASLEGGVDLLDPARLSLLARRTGPGRAGQERYHRVPRDAQCDNAPAMRRNVQDDDRVRALAGDASAELLVRAGSAVRADQQDVHGAG